MSWTWEKASPRERAAFIREHQTVRHDALARLFGLSDEGVKKILEGWDWCPAYEFDWNAPPVPYEAIRQVKERI